MENMSRSPFKVTCGTQKWGGGGIVGILAQIFLSIHVAKLSVFQLRLKGQLRQKGRNTDSPWSLLTTLFLTMICRCEHCIATHDAAHTGDMANQILARSLFLILFTLDLKRNNSDRVWHPCFTRNLSDSEFSILVVNDLPHQKLDTQGPVHTGRTSSFAWKSFDVVCGLCKLTFISMFFFCVCLAVAKCQIFVRKDGSIHCALRDVDRAIKRTRKFLAQASNNSWLHKDLSRARSPLCVHHESGWRSNQDQQQATMTTLRSQHLFSDEIFHLFENTDELVFSMR